MGKKSMTEQKTFFPLDTETSKELEATGQRQAMANSQQSHAEETLADQGPPTIEGESVFVIDAFSLIYQVFYAVGDMTSPVGQPVNAVFGFLRDILDIIEKKQPRYIICAFDMSENTFRNDMYDQYKANRDPMPDDLRSQIPLIQKLLEAMSIPVLQHPNFEADDVMATVARVVDEEKGSCFLVTSDKDCRQLITDHVKIYNIRKNLIYNEANLEKDWGIRPNQVVDFQAMVGDAVDNVPGLPSIGPKTAKKFLDEFDSLDGLLDNLEQLKSKKQQEKVRDNRSLALLSRDLVRLDNQVPIEIDWSEAQVGDIDRERCMELCGELGFRTLGQRVNGLPVVNRTRAVWETDYQLVSDLPQLTALVERLMSVERLALDTETTSISPRHAQLVGISLAWEEGKAAYVPVRAPAGQPQLDLEQVVQTLRPLLENPNIEKVGQNLKYDLIVLRAVGLEVKGDLFDTMVSDFLLDAGRRGHGMDDLANRYLNHETVKIKELIGTGKKQIRMDQVDVALVTDYACEDVDVPFRLYPLLKERLRAEQLESLYDDLEMPLIRVLADMEYTGIAVEAQTLEDLSLEFASEIENLKESIFELAGERFNLDSPQQLATVLFDQLELPVVKKTATGRSTAAEVLEVLAESHELPRQVMEYRQYAKLKSTYTDALVTLVHPQTHRVHSSFMQDGAATGRLSSRDPNLQNIPVRTAAGKRIRQAFVPQPANWQLLSADYSQIELRMLAHFSGDEALKNAFAADLDIHTSVAAEVYGVPLDDVTKDMRRAAKSINFGIIYGQTSFGLAKAIGISKEEAAGFIDAYFARYPGVEAFTTDVLKRAYRDGEVHTILGRRRQIEGVRDPDKQSTNRFRNFPERIAINTVIQGSAADLIKLAMINLAKELQPHHDDIRLLLQIHDELVFELDPDRQADLVPIVEKEMISAVELSVPLKVDVEVGSNWGETFGIERQRNKS